jgi:hypothetical protein
MSIFYILICVFSFALRLAVSLNIYNQCKEINLTSPVYFIHGGKWYAELDQKIDTDAKMQNHIELDAKQDILEGALVYRVQRKHTVPAQDESKGVWLLITWNSDYTKEPDVCALVIEHNKQLDEDRLRKMYQKSWSLFKTRASITKNNWVLSGMAILITTVSVTNGGYGWRVSISEEEE